MGKTQEHSDDVRRKVVELHKSRNGHKKISKELKIPISTIMEIVKKFKATGDVRNQPGRGPICKLTPRTVRRMVRLAKESPRITAGELQKLIESWGQKVSKTTIRRHLHHHKLFWRVARKKPLLSINNKLKRLQFAKCKSDLQWGRVIWSDETKIKLFGNKHSGGGHSGGCMDGREEKACELTGRGAPLCATCCATNLEPFEGNKGN